MRLSTGTLAAACFVLAVATPISRPPADEPPRSPSSLSPAGIEPPAAVVTVGDLAPDVAWDGPDARPQHLRDLRAQGHVLLVFFPREEQLVALERERDRLLDARIVPAAVVNRGRAGTAALAARLSLHFTLIPDPRGIVAAQFNALDPASRGGMPAWFVLDRWGRVRALDRGNVPEGGFARLAAGALHLPLPNAPLPTRAR